MSEILSDEEHEGLIEDYSSDSSESSSVSRDKREMNVPSDNLIHIAILQQDPQYICHFDKVLNLLAFFMWNWSA